MTYYPVVSEHGFAPGRPAVIALWHRAAVSGLPRREFTGAPILHKQIFATY